MLPLHPWPILLKSLFFYAYCSWGRYRYYNRLRCESPHEFLGSRFSCGDVITATIGYTATFFRLTLLLDTSVLLKSHLYFDSWIPGYVTATINAKLLKPSLDFSIHVSLGDATATTIADIATLELWLASLLGTLPKKPSLVKFSMVFRLCCCWGRCGYYHSLCY